MGGNKYISVVKSFKYDYWVGGSVDRWVGEQVVGGRLTSGLAVREFKKTL